VAGRRLQTAKPEILKEKDKEPKKARPFWKTIALADMSRAQWESLCDGCGKCCLVKLRDAETDEVLFTNIACKALKISTCRCGDYKNRHRIVPDCVKLTARRLTTIDWLPGTCAYRLLAEGKDLPAWHPLLTGDPESVHKAGMSVRRRAISERQAGEPEDHIVDWAK